MLDHIKKIIRLKHVIIIAVNALLLLAFAGCLIFSGAIKRPLHSQQAAAAWAGQSGERFSQISVFFPESVSFNVENIHDLYPALDQALLGVSLESTPDRALYKDAWSAGGEVSVVSERGQTTAPVIGVGGDFFLFHPLRLRDGSYISPGDIMKDRVVLDEELAWRLFGSVRLAGFEVFINNRPFKIAGVISRENDFSSKKAYSGGAGLFMSYEVLAEMRDGEISIGCYEIVMPDPITGFAVGALKDSLTDPGVQIVENSVRFSLSNSFRAIGSFGERSMQKVAIEYPYWENAARYAEDWLALLLLLALLFILCPVVCGVIYGVKLIRFALKHSKTTFSRLVAEHDDRAYEKYLLEHDGEHQIYDVNEIIREMRDDR